MKRALKKLVEKSWKNLEKYKKAIDFWQKVKYSKQACFTDVEKKIDTLADGLLATNERIDRLTERMDDMNETVLANTMYIVKDARDKGQAKAQ